MSFKGTHEPKYKKPKMDIILHATHFELKMMPFSKRNKKKLNPSNQLLTRPTSAVK